MPFISFYSIFTLRYFSNLLSLFTVTYRETNQKCSLFDICICCIEHQSA